MHFVVRSSSGEREVDIDIELALLAGYTGRDQEAVQAHVAEIAPEGCVTFEVRTYDRSTSTSTQ